MKKKSIASEFDRITGILQKLMDIDVARKDFFTSRKREYSMARMFIAYILRKKGFTLESIGAFLHKNHATILYAVEKVEGMNVSYGEDYERLTIIKMMVGLTKVKPLKERIREIINQPEYEVKYSLDMEKRLLRVFKQFIKMQEL